MTLDQWRINQGWTWEKVARELSALCKSYGEEPLYYNRVWHFRRGVGSRPKPHHIRALLELTDNEVESYREPE